MLHNDINFFYIILTNFFAFKFLIIAIYDAYFVNLFIRIKIELLILLIYGFFVNDKSMMKFIVIILNEFTLFNEININLL